MNLLEIILLAIILGFGVFGYMTGLIQAVGSIIGLFVGFAVATRYADAFAGIFLPLYGGNHVAATITAFIILFVVASKVVGLLFYAVDRVFRLLAIIPGLQLLNRLGGLLLGLLEGILVIGIILNVISHLPVASQTVALVSDSWFLRSLRAVSTLVIAVFPRALDTIRSSIR